MLIENQIYHSTVINENFDLELFLLGMTNAFRSKCFVITVLQEVIMFIPSIIGKFACLPCWLPELMARVVDWLVVFFLGSGRAVDLTPQWTPAAMWSGVLALTSHHLQC